MSKSIASFGHPAWVRQRELRERLPLGHSDIFCKGLYSSFHKINSSNSDQGAVTSLDFCPDGSLLAVGCVRNWIQMFDPLSRKQIKVLDNSEMGYLNTVKFLNSWIFAIGGESQAVSLWDTRNLKKCVRKLVGHSSCVRHIEFSSRNDVLVTTGDDGTILVWNLNNTIGGVTKCTKFGSDDLWGIRLNPDASKMIISSTGGFLIIVHDLDLNTVAEDLAGFYPGVGPSLDDEGPSVPRVNVFSRSRKRNRAEAVVDFPHMDVYNNVSALEIHPQGWSALSLCMSPHLGIEWVCVHDIRDKLPLPSGLNFNEQDDEVDIPRLTHYIERHTSVKNICIFKEISFSPDGRLICCPLGSEIKLLAFSPLCSEQFISWSGGEPIPLHEIATFDGKTYVYSAKFSPRHCLLVSGCENETICWYQPVLV